MKVTDNQIEFARRMTERQWMVLQWLADAPFYMSVTERADPELSALMTHGVACGFSPVPGIISGLWGWVATDTGRTLLKMRAAGKL
jgi:hypothetical protein